MPDAAEVIERAALLDLFDIAGPSLKRRLGLDVREIAGATLLMAAMLPATAIVVNRVCGLGLAQSATRDDVAAIDEAYRSAGVPRYFLHWHPDAAPPDLPDAFAEFGLERARAWQLFEHNRDIPPDAPTRLTIREARSGDAEAFGRIACAAFDLGEEAGEWIAGLVDHPNFRTVMSFDGESPAGIGALYVMGEHARIDWGATDPGFRRRGSQSAILRHRILLAEAAGCHTIHTETGEAVPGDPQHSHSNIRRAGFEETILRKNYAWPKQS